MTAYANGYPDRTLLRINREHDQRYGWDSRYGGIYTRPDPTCSVVTAPAIGHPDLWTEIRKNEWLARWEGMQVKERRKPSELLL